MIRELVQTLVCLSVLNGSTLSLHLNNDRTAEHSSSSGGNPSLSGATDMLQLHQHSNNPYRAMATAAESDRERMLLFGGGRRGRPIVTGRLHLTVDEPDGGANYQTPPLTMLQDNEFPIRREPFFFVGDDDDGGDGGGGDFEDFRRTSHNDERYDDGNYEVMDDIFNHDEGIYRKLPLIHRPMAHQYHSHSTPARGLQELFDHHDTGDLVDQLGPSHRFVSQDMRFQKKLQRKRTQQKQALKKLQSPGTKSPSTEPATASSSTSSQKQQQQQQQQQQKQQQQQAQNTNQPQQQLLHPNSNNKRSGINSGIGSPPVTHSIASQLMLRTARGQRQYDVPQIECPSAIDGMERFACPTPDLQGRYRCIDDHVLCDGFIDCPEGEDEDRRSCMFYKTTKAHLDVLADALLRWARGR